MIGGGGIVALHKSISGADVHVPHAWEYTTKADRENATGLESTDVHKLALQTDDLSFWVLENHDPVTWVAVGEGEQTQALVEDLLAVALFVVDNCENLEVSFFIDGFHNADEIDAGASAATYIAASNLYVLGNVAVVDDFENLSLPGWAASDPTNSPLNPYATAPHEGLRSVYWRSRSGGFSLGDRITKTLSPAQDWQSIRELSWWHRKIVANGALYKVRILDSGGDSVLSVDEFDPVALAVNEWANLMRDPQDPADFAAEVGTIDFTDVAALEFEITTEGPDTYNYNGFDYIVASGYEVGRRLQSEPQSLPAVPREIYALALGSDLDSGVQLSVSRDGGATWTDGDLKQWIDVSAQPSGSSLVLRLTTTDALAHSVFAWGAVWR